MEPLAAAVHQQASDAVLTTSLFKVREVPLRVVRLAEPYSQAIS